MAKAGIHTITAIVLASLILFACYLPILDLLSGSVALRWIGDLSSGRTPLIEHISWIYSEPGVLAASSIVSVLLLIELVLLMQTRGYRLRAAIAIMLLPFSVALLIQYCVWIDLDDQLYWLSFGGPIPWPYLIQFPLILQCLGIALIYSGVVALVWLVVGKIRSIYHTTALTKRWS